MFFDATSLEPIDNIFSVVFMIKLMFVVIGRKLAQRSRVLRSVVRSSQSKYSGPYLQRVQHSRREKCP